MMGYSNRGVNCVFYSLMIAAFEVADGNDHVQFACTHAR